MRTHFGKVLFAAALAGLWAGCSFAPKYSRPTVETPASFKENSGANNTDTNIWQLAQPNDAVIRSNWWEMFNDPVLNSLEEQVAISNQNVVAALENYLSAHAIVREDQAQYYPLATAGPSVTKSRQFSSGFSQASPYHTIYDIPFDASWEPDLWGKIYNTVKSAKGTAQADAADLENAKLSAQAELASDYFQLQGQDALEKLFDDTVNAYSNSLKLTQVLFKTGIDSDQDVAQAQTQLDTTEAQATNLRILRAQLEHAIAVLMGRAPGDFSIPRSPLIARPPNIPVALPSQLLERRPDIAAQERAVFSANAEIGVARSAFFPNISLTASGGFESLAKDNLFDWSSRVYSIGAAASQPLFNAALPPGLAQYNAQYRGAVASYRQTVLSAFQGVEDNLVALRVYKTQIAQQEVAVNSSQNYLNLALYRYKLGIDSYLNVITAQTTLLSNSQTLVNLYTQQMMDAVLLVEDLGGGWDASQLPKD
ncbi:MAG TPA: efflux transporter outer membrane subunit [Candidatus Sulfotelmatobacter sp.]|nr:efflux transporter outer membrane subunit [Candidatus Sulfotelmatobacter sp.]